MADIGQALLHGRARGRLAALLSAAAIFYVWYTFQDHSPRTAVDHAQATVMAVKQAGVGLRLASGETATIYPPNGITLRTAEVVPVIIETYESGKRIVIFDRDRWAAGR